MLGAALTPVIVTIVMWVNIFYSIAAGDPISSWDWVIVSLSSIGSCGYIAYSFKKITSRIFN